MEQSKVESLTPTERKVLRLAWDHGQVGAADAVARELDCSVNTVNNHLKSARRKLSVGSSAAAARLLAEAEGRSQRLASQALAIPTTPFLGEAVGAEPPTWAAGPQGRVAEERTVFVPELAATDERPPLLNRLSKPQRLALVILVAAVIALGSFAALAIPLVLQAVRHH